MLEKVKLEHQLPLSLTSDDTTFTGVTKGKAQEALRDAADRSARMQERERQDAQAGVSDTMGSGGGDNESDGVGSSGNLGGASGVGASTGAGSTSGIDGVEQAAVEQAADNCRRRKQR